MRTNRIFVLDLKFNNEEDYIETKQIKSIAILRSVVIGFIQHQLS